jgi:uncharacterized protein
MSRFAIADLFALVDAVLARSTGKESRLHGEHHWQLVGWVGAELVADTPVADPTVVFLFALFHDSMREHDGQDAGHGSRGAALARDLWPRHRFATVSQMDALTFACEEHTSGGVTDEPTVAVCWDADRLNLWRVGTEPDPAFLSTATARDPGRIAAAAPLQRESRTWREVAAALGLDDRR